MNWILLILGGLFEVGFASCLVKAKHATGMEAYGWYAGFIVCLTFSMLLLIKATQTLPIGTAYAVWTGIGAVGTVLVGILVFHSHRIHYWFEIRLFTLTELETNPLYQKCY